MLMVQEEAMETGHGCACSTLKAYCLSCTIEYLEQPLGYDAEYDGEGKTGFVGVLILYSYYMVQFNNLINT